MPAASEIVRLLRKTGTDGASSRTDVGRRARLSSSKASQADAAAVGNHEFSVTQSGVEVVQDPELSKDDRPLRVAVYLKVWADLLPRKTELSVDIDIMADVSSVLQAFRVASDLLGTDPRAGLRRLKRIAPMIEHER